jgi:ferrous iron transport protein A
MSRTRNTVTDSGSAAGKPTLVTVSRGERQTTLADVRVGGYAVLVTGGGLDARQARRLIELGLRPGATVWVMMRTSGGGRVLGVDNLRIVVDKKTLTAIPVMVPRTMPSTRGPRGTTGLEDRTRDRTRDRAPAPMSTSGAASTADTFRVTDAIPVIQVIDGERHRGSGRGPAPSRLQLGRRRLRLLGGGPGLTVLRGEPFGDGAD